MEGVHGGEFVYAVVFDEAEGVLATVGEDNNLRILKFHEDTGQFSCIQTVPHPGTVWSVAVTPDSDVLTACSDGVARLFTRDPARFAAPDLVAAFEISVAARQVSSKMVGGVDLEKLPKAEDILGKPGATDGQQAIVRKGKGAEVHTWSEAEGKWIKVGDVVEGPQDETGGKVVHGVKYDYVFDVDIEEGKPHKKLGYNKGTLSSHFSVLRWFRLLMHNPALHESPQARTRTRQRSGLSTMRAFHRIFWRK